jgi:hypothetical protein
MTTLLQAVDLGLNQNSDKWQFRGADLFSPEEKQIRKQIWWSCCLADKSGLHFVNPLSLLNPSLRYGSIYMGTILNCIILLDGAHSSLCRASDIHQGK